MQKFLIVLREMESSFIIIFFKPFEPFPESLQIIGLLRLIAVRQEIHGPLAGRHLGHVRQQGGLSDAELSRDHHGYGGTAGAEPVQAPPEIIDLRISAVETFFRHGARPGIILLQPEDLPVKGRKLFAGFLLQLLPDQLLIILVGLDRHVVLSARGICLHGFFDDMLFIRFELMPGHQRLVQFFHIPHTHRIRDQFSRGGAAPFLQLQPAFVHPVIEPGGPFYIKILEEFLPLKKKFFLRKISVFDKNSIGIQIQPVLSLGLDRFHRQHLLQLVQCLPQVLPSGLLVAVFPEDIDQLIPQRALIDAKIIEDPLRFPVREMDPLLFITDKYAGGTEQNDFYMISDIGHIFSPQKPSDTYHYENIRIKQYYIQIISASNRQVN